MKVLHVYKTYLPDNFTGVPHVIWEISEGLAGRGVESHVLSLSTHPAGHPVATGQHLTHQAREDLFLASTGLSVSVFSTFRGLIADADVVHYHYPWPMADLLHLSLGRKTASVLTYHSDIIKQRVMRSLYYPLQELFLSRVDSIVATSSQYAQTSPALKRYAGKVSVIPIGIGERTDPSAQCLASWRARVGEGFFLFVGAPRYYKGLHFLIEAARLSGLPVVIAGGNPPDTANRPLPPNVTVVGFVEDEDKEALLSLCRAFVLPSHLRSEAFGIALVEAARAGRPMISCEIGTGTSYVNAHGETGYVVAPQSPVALAGMMQKLNSDPALADRLGANARARYQRLFRASDMAEAYFKFYCRLTRGSGT